MGKISVEFRENISNFKDCIALTSSLVRISSLANLSKLATRGRHQKIPQGPLPCWYSMGLILLIALKLLANVIGTAAAAAAAYPL